MKKMFLLFLMAGLSMTIIGCEGSGKTATDILDKAKAIQGEAERTVQNVKKIIGDGKQETEKKEPEKKEADTKEKSEKGK
jgi:hypothetical protein